MRGDTTAWPDVALHCGMLLADGQPAWDVGCGTGRLLLTYLDLGLDVDGVELSPEMIASCRRAAAERGLEPTIHQVAMQDLDLQRRYRTILVPSSSFQLLTEQRDAKSAMRRYFEHLQPGGGLALSCMVFWREGNPLEQPWHIVAEAEDPEQGTRIRRSGMVTHDVQARLQHTRACNTCAPATHTRSLRGARWRRSGGDREPRTESGIPLVLAGGGARALPSGGVRGRARHAGFHPLDRRGVRRTVRSDEHATGWHSRRLTACHGSVTVLTTGHAGGRLGD